MSGGAIETAIAGLWLLATSQQLTLLGVSTQKTLCPLSPVGLQGDMEQGKKHCLGGELGGSSGEWKCGFCLYRGLIHNVLLLCVVFYLFLAVLGLHCCTGISLVAVSRHHSLVAVHGLLTAVASPVKGAQALGAWAQWLCLPGLVVVVHWLGWSEARGIFLDQG